MRTLFGTDGVRGIANRHPITSEIAMLLGRAFVRVLGEEGSGHPVRVVVGKDTRLSGAMIECALASGISSMGGDVLLVGAMPTPACAHLVRSFAADGGVVISASHNPAEDNGIKFFSRDGYKLPDPVEERMEDLVGSGALGAGSAGPGAVGRVRTIGDARGRYIEFVKQSIDNLSLSGLRLVLDCANGAASGIAPLVLSELGADVTTFHDAPDGLNINHECGSEHPGFTQQRVVEEGADGGLILDGDADRLLLVDEAGRLIDGDRILVVCARNLKDRGLLDHDTIVVTEYSNTGLEIALRRDGIRVERVANGDRYVMEAMREKGYLLGGERSGHIIFRHHNTTSDGLITALQVLRLVRLQGMRLSDVAGSMEDLPQAFVNVEIPAKPPLEGLRATCQVISDVRQALGSHGRVYVRYSGTQSLCRIMVEGEDPGRIHEMADTIAGTVREEVLALALRGGSPSP